MTWISGDGDVVNALLTEGMVLPESRHPTYVEPLRWMSKSYGLKRMLLCPRGMAPLSRPRKRFPELTQRSFNNQLHVLCLSSNCLFSITFVDKTIVVVEKTFWPTLGIRFQERPLALS